MDASDAVRGLSVLADPTRTRIVSLILHSADGRELVGRLATALGLRQPTISHHVKALVEQGVLERAPDGRTVWYSIAADQLERVSQLLRSAGDESVPEDVLVRVSGDLATRFAGSFAPETVDRYVRESHELLAQRAGIARHLPSLTSHFAADRLSALAVRRLPDAGRTPEVLFVCVQNAGRSQMAAAILRHLAGDRVHVRTAGSQPANAVRSVVVTVLDEIGVSVRGEYPKPLTDEVVRAADLVITMGCGDACPVYPGRTYLDWTIADPVGLPTAEVRDIRDDIEGRVRELLATLQVKNR